MVQGLAELNRRFSAIPDRVRASVVEAMEKAADEIVADMRRLAPKGGTGNLAASINWTWGDAPKGSLVIGKAGGGREYGSLQITIYAGSDKAFYARWVEFGTRPHVNKGRFAGTQHPGTTAQPFFYPVWRVWRRRVRSRISRAITKAIRAS